MAEKKLKDGSIYRVEPMLATRAIVLQARLLRLFGGAIERLPEIMSGYGDKASAEAKDKSNTAAIAALTDIFTKADPEEVASIIAEVVEAGTISPNGSTGFRKCTLDGDFSDRQSDLYPVAIYALQEQFGDFFTDVLPSGAPSKNRTPKH